MIPINVAGSSAGLQNDIKPYLLTDQAFSRLENAYVWRERVRKRECLELLGRLRRRLTAQALGLTVAAQLTYTLDIFTLLTITEPDAELEPGTLVITIAAPDAATFTDNGNGTFTVTGKGVSALSSINYVTGIATLVLTNPVVGAATITANLNYFPSLPVMGSDVREIALVNDEQEIWFDTIYAYIFVGTGFQEFIPGTVWAGTNADYFWTFNYRGITPDVRLFFVTNFVNNAANPIRYTDGATWTNFAPLVADNPPSANSVRIWQTKLIVAYYGRLLFFNTWEGQTQVGSVNFYNRLRFSQIGDPTAVDAFRSDQFGKGGFIDAPIDESIVGVSFFKNTLIVDFERSTWQLRYIGEYGLPFIFERISSDYGSESMLSGVTFDAGNLKVGDKAITGSTSTNVQRIDPQIPDFVFNISNSQKFRVQGIRDFQRELVFWTYNDSQNPSTFPNRVLVYNYRNNTYAIFRDNVNSFGTFQDSTAITWDSLDIFWDDEDITWDDPDNQTEFNFIVAGNQQGWVHKYGYTTPDDASLSVTGVTLTTSIVLTIVNHNLEIGDYIRLEGLLFVDSTTLLPITTNLNGSIYIVNSITTDTVTILQWNGAGFSTPVFTPTAGFTYIGAGKVALLPLMYIQSKDFNPFQDKGLQTKLCYIDLLTDANPSAVVSLKLFINSSMATQANLIVGNKQIETALVATGFITAASQSNPAIITSPAHSLKTGNQILIQNVQGMTQLNNNIYSITYVDANNFSLDGIDSSAFTAYIRAGNYMGIDSAFYVPGSDYAWHRFFATVTGQYFRFVITYDEALMSNITTHQQTFILNAFTLYVRPGGKSVF